jgi:hypothetical protein
VVINIAQRVDQLGLGHGGAATDIQFVGPLQQFLPLAVAIRTSGAIVTVAALALVLAARSLATGPCSGHALLLSERLSSGAYYPDGPGLHGALADPAGSRVPRRRRARAGGKRPPPAEGVKASPFGTQGQA